MAPPNRRMQENPTLTAAGRTLDDNDIVVVVSDPDGDPVDVRVPVGDLGGGASAFDGLTDVDPTGKVPGSIFHWDAVDGTYNPSPLNVASDGTTDLVASQDTDVLRLHIGSSPAVFSVLASNDGEDTSQQLQVNATGVYVNGVALGNAASKNVGTTAGTVAAGDDSRLSDTRTPSDDSVTSAKIVNGSVTNTDMADMAAKTVKMRHTNSTGAPEDTSMANLLADLSAQAGADFSFNAHKVTGVTEGAAAGEAATYAATPAGIVTAKGDLIFGTGSHTAARSAAPTNNKFWCADSNQSNGFTAVDLPWLQKVDVLRDLPYSATGFASQLALAGNYAQMTALNDEAVFYLQFGAGTWSFNCWRTTFSSYGILTCSIDGTTIATLDNYSGGSVNPGQSTTTGISITVPGVYAFKIKTTSKNASSSGYNQRIWGLSFTRTA